MTTMTDTKKMTKTARVIQIMNENVSKPMAEVAVIIENQLPCKEGYGKTWYRWSVNNNVAPGVIPARVKKTKVARSKVNTPVVSAKKPSLISGVFGEKKTEEQIKLANLAKIKEVAEKFNSTKMHPMKVTQAA